MPTAASGARHVRARSSIRAPRTMALFFAPSDMPYQKSGRSRCDRAGDPRIAAGHAPRERLALPDRFDRAPHRGPRAPVVHDLRRVADRVAVPRGRSLRGAATRPRALPRRAARRTPRAPGSRARRRPRAAHRRGRPRHWRAARGRASKPLTRRPNTISTSTSRARGSRGARCAARTPAAGAARTR